MIDQVETSWPLVSIGNLVDARTILLINGFAHGGFNEDGRGVPHIRPFNIGTNGEIDFSQIKYVESPSASSGYWVRLGDVVFNNTNSEDLVGKTAYWGLDGDYVISNHMTLLRVLDASVVEPYWLATEMHRLWRQGLFKSVCRRYVGQASISLSRLQTIEIPLPPLPEQRAIARVLRAVKAARAARQREASLERERKAALMDHLFTRGTRGEATKQTPIGEMPESWEVVRVEEAYQFTKKPHGLSYSDYDEIPFVPMELVPIDSPTFTNFIIRSGKEVSSGTYFELGDLLIAKITPSFENGKQSVMNALPTPFAIATTEVIPIQSTPGMSDKFFLHYFLLRPNVRSELASKMEGTTGRQRLGKHIVSNTLIPLPHLAEQQEIVKTLHACDANIAALDRESALLDELFRALLEELMSGRVSLQKMVA